MVLRYSLRATFCFILCASATLAWGANHWGLTPGSVDLRSAGLLTFGTGGISLIGDPESAAVFEVGTEDTESAGDSACQLDDLTANLKATYSASDVTVGDMAVNPVSRNVYFSLTVTQQEKVGPRIARIDVKGNLSAVSVQKVDFARVGLPNAAEATGPTPSRSSGQPITDIAYLDGRVNVSGTGIGATR
jgi:hypothetical protein